MTTTVTLYLLFMTVSTVYGLCIWHLAGWVKDFQKAHQAMDSDLSTAETAINEHAQLLEALNEMQAKLESLSVRMATVETNDRRPTEKEEDDVLYVSRR